MPLTKAARNSLPLERPLPPPLPHPPGAGERARQPPTPPAARAQPPLCSAKPQPASGRPCHGGDGRLTAQPGQHLRARPRLQGPGCSRALAGPPREPPQERGRSRLPTSWRHGPPPVTMATATPSVVSRFLTANHRCPLPDARAGQK